MRTTIVSDLHVGTRSERDLLRRPAALDALCAKLTGTDRLVLLGDVLELRDSPVSKVLAEARPVFERIGEAVGDASVLVVPGNHDHQLAGDWLERRRREGSLEAEELVDAESAGLAAQLARWMPTASVLVAYPGAWIRPDVYVTHGHYLDCHNSVPSFETLAAAATARALERRAAEGRADGDASAADRYESALAPLYAFSYSLAQGMSAGARPNVPASVRIWERLNGGRGRFDPGAALFGRVLLPGMVAGLNRAGLGPFRADLSGPELRRAGLRAIDHVLSRLGVEATYAVFGHTHRSGPWPDDHDASWTTEAGVRLVNTGSWIHEPVFVRAGGRSSPYWPGVVAVIEGDGPPRLESLLAEIPGARVPGR